MNKPTMQKQLSAFSKGYDIDGDGVLDEAEQQMKDMDVDRKGYIDAKEIHSIIEKKMSSEKQASHLRLWITILAVAVVLLSISNIGLPCCQTQQGH